MIQLRSNSGIEIPTDELPRIFDKFIPNGDPGSKVDWARLALVKN